MTTSEVLNAGDLILSESPYQIDPDFKLRMCEGCKDKLEKISRRFIRKEDKNVVNTNKLKRGEL